MRPNLNPLHTSFHPSAPRPQDNPTSSPTRSPTSPTTTASISSPSPPTSPFYHPRRPTYGPSSIHHRGRRLHHHHHHPNNPNHCSNPNSSTSPSPSPGPGPGRHGRGRQPSPFRLSASSLESYPSSSPRALSSAPNIFLRRRPSRAEIALSEERWRAEEDKIERLGLELLEPRPVSTSSSSSASTYASAALGIGGFDDADALGGMGMSMDGAVQMDSDWMCHSPGSLASRWSGLSWGGGGLGVGSQQRVVMGGIFEVMEGRG